MNDLDLTPLRSKWELVKSERGKTWTVAETFTVTAKDGRKLTVPAGFVHDRFSIAPDCNDNRAAATHDFAYTKAASGRRWDDGSKITKGDADNLMRYLMEQSDDSQARERAAQYYHFVRWYGWKAWITGTWRSVRESVEDI